MAMAPIMPMAMAMAATRAKRSVSRTERQSPRAWIVRGSLAAVALVVGYGSTTGTLAFVIAKTNAERAYRLAPHDGRVAGELAEQIVTRNTDNPRRMRGNQLARQALADEGLAASALTALALNAQLSGDTVYARTLFHHSDALSRREFGTRLWLIEDAVGRGDIPQALKEYDIALRTTKSASEVLFPILSEAISDPAIADALANRLVAFHPPWGQVFVVHMTGTGAGPTVDAAFLRRLTARGYPVPATAWVAVVDALVTNGKFDDAWSYYATFRKGIDRRSSRDPQFNQQPANPSLFDWKLAENESGIIASIRDPGQDGGFEFMTPSTIGGTALQQTQLLPPGRYRIEGVTSGVDQDAQSQPYWQLVCNDGRDAGRIELPRSSVDNGRFAGNVVVPANCPAQVLQLVIRPSSAMEGVSGQVRKVALTPAG